MQRENEVQHVFLVGAKSLGAYGGYETFVYKLTEYHQNKKNIKYHVACKKEGDTVAVGQTLVVLEAMKMENNIDSDRAGVVKSIKVNRGDSVLEGDVLITLG